MKITRSLTVEAARQLIERRTGRLLSANAIHKWIAKQYVSAQRSSPAPQSPWLIERGEVERIIRLMRGTSVDLGEVANA